MSRFARGLTSLLLCGTLAALMTVPTSTTGAMADNGAAEAAAEVAGAGAGDVVGTGWLDVLLCIGCVAVIGAAGGGTVAGVVAVTALAPEAVAGCALGCYLAFSE